MTALTELGALRKRMKEISGSWNGDEPGLREDNAHIAEDIIEKIKEINELLEGLQL